MYRFVLALWFLASLLPSEFPKLEIEAPTELDPVRSPGYPDNTLEDVLRHEVAHILIWRASAGRPVPRWFNEGLAMEVERMRRFQDQTQLLYQLITGGRTSLEHLDRLFAGSQN